MLPYRYRYGVLKKFQLAATTVAACLIALILYIRPADVHQLFQRIALYFCNPFKSCCR